MIINNPYFGSDVEFFVENNEGKIVTAEGLIKGSKWEPFCFDPTNRDYKTSLDCVLAEGNIPPVNTMWDWVNNLAILREYINSTLPEGYKTVGTAYVEMDEDQLTSQTARTFGCDPSMNCWTMQRMKPPRVKKGSTGRSAGFHVHCSFETDEGVVPVGFSLIRTMDLTLSVPSVLIEPYSKRKELYGKAGEFRFGKSYQGVEFRGLSSWWSQSKEQIEYVYQNTQLAIDMINRGFNIDNDHDDAKLIQKAINENDCDLAKELVDKYQIALL